MLFNFECLSPFFRSAGRATDFFLLQSRSILALSACVSRPIKFLKERSKIIKRGIFIKAKELLLFDLLIGDGIFTNCIFEQLKGVEEVDVGIGVVDVEFIMLFETAADIVKFIDLFLNLAFFSLENFLKMLSILLLFFLN